MLIKDLSQDPIEFIIQNETILTEYLKDWNNKSLKQLLGSHDLLISGNKDTLVKNILDGVKFGNISLVSLQSWFKKNLREGKRHLFIFDIVPEHSKQLSDINCFEGILSANEALERKDHLYKDVEDGLVVFNYSIKDNKVESIMLAYKEEKMLRLPNYETGSIDTKSIDYHIFIDIKLEDNIMYINLEPTTGLIENNENDATVSVKKIASRYKNVMEEIFSLKFLDPFEITQKALYRIWQDATRYELPEIIDILDSITSDVNNFVSDISKEDKLALNQDIQNKLVTKVLSNIENSILTSRYDEYKEKIEQARKLKPGYITEQRIRERTGSTLNQKSADKLTPIEHADSFSDTRVTIDELERVQKLYYTWRGLDDIPPGVISTIIESFKEYDLVIFSSHSALEEIKHVLNQFKRYKDKIRNTRPSHI
ncbi:hypothetical protein ACUIJN_22730 [Metabacillus halosaccharovorans]|uniref:hypothetical protein n=1 Tax=Metabacillus halosaccharovorans TaxID=930124 RepID=UPI00403DA455